MNKLRQLIRESINEYIRDIDEAGNVAALEAKMGKTKEAIELREKKMNMDGLDEAYHDMLDKGKVKELSNEVKALKKSLAKYEKQLEKLNKKGEKITKVEDTEEKEIVDETSLSEGVTDFPFTSKEDIKDAWQEIYDNILDNMSSLEKLDNEETTGLYGDKVGEKADDVFLTKYGMSYMDALNNVDNMEDTNIYEMLYMQKLAGIISETEYKAKVEEAKKKPSAGMTKKEKSAVVKKAHAGKDIGKKGKGFEDVAKAAGGGEKGKKIAAAAMWKGEAKK